MASKARSSCLPHQCLELARLEHDSLQLSGEQLMAPAVLVTTLASEVDESIRVRAHEQDEEVFIYNSWTVAKLRAELGACGVATTGKKDELVSRLIELTGVQSEQRRATGDEDDEDSADAEGAADDDAARQAEADQLFKSFHEGDVEDSPDNDVVKEGIIEPPVLALFEHDEVNEADSEQRPAAGEGLLQTPPPTKSAAASQPSQQPQQCRKTRKTPWYALKSSDGEIIMCKDKEAVIRWDEKNQCFRAQLQDNSIVSLTEFERLSGSKLRSLKSSIRLKSSGLNLRAAIEAALASPASSEDISGTTKLPVPPEVSNIMEPTIQNLSLLRAKWRAQRSEARQHSAGQHSQLGASWPAPQQPTVMLPAELAPQPSNIPQGAGSPLQIEMSPMQFPSQPSMHFISQDVIKLIAQPQHWVGTF